jgi:hypothetical protein
MKRVGDPNRDEPIKASGTAPATFQRQSREEPKHPPYEMVLPLVNLAQPWV